MILAVILCLFVIFIVDLWFTKDLLHPAVITSFVWFIVISVFTFVDHDLFPISDLLYKIVLLWVFFFSLGSVFFSKIKVKTTPFTLAFNSSNYFILYFFVVLATTVLIALLIQKAGGLSLSMITSLRESQLNETNPLIVISYYINSFCLVFFAYSLLNSSKISYKLLFVLGFLLFFVTLLKTNKTSIFQLFFIVFYILYVKKKLNLKLIVILSSIVLVIVYSFTLLRDSGGGDFDLVRYVSIYLLSPLPAFDLFVVGDLYAPKTVSWGSGTFGFFYSFFQAFGFHVSKEVYFEWVFVPFPTNVFTIMSTYYIDFGMEGIVFGSFFLGGIWGLLFKFQKGKSLFAIVFYSVVFYALFFQFFADFLFATLSITFQYVISTLIICLLLNKKSIHV